MLDDTDGFEVETYIEAIAASLLLPSISSRSAENSNGPEEIGDDDDLNEAADAPCVKDTGEEPKESDKPSHLEGASLAGVVVWVGGPLEEDADVLGLLRRRRRRPCKYYCCYYYRVVQKFRHLCNFRWAAD